VTPRGLRERPPAGLATIAVAFLDTAEAHQALDAAAVLAERAGAARLRLVSVMRSPAEVFLPVVGRDAEEAFVASTREAFQRALDDADLLVCGSRAYGPLRRVLLGGVSSRLLRRAVLPLVVVPRSGEAGDS
jgi:nucleotide-binding universal stress UspA family protein